MDKISFVIPVFNEEGNLERLIEELTRVAGKLAHPYEIVLVDDCSTDGSLELIRGMAAGHASVRYLSFETNCGQSAALYAGFQHAAGDIVITMDADLQNDPDDIPALLEHFGKYDMVNGRRVDRRDTFSKKIGSRVGNYVRNRLTWETIRDTGCSLKVMRSSMLKRIRMFRGLHRFLPTLMRLEGARVIEVPVHHRPRMHGVSKYSNLRRGIEGLYDVIAVRWMIKRHLKIRIKETDV